MYRRSIEVKVGDLIIGGNHALSIQSMTNTHTLDTKATVAQAEALAQAGCQLIRIAVQGMKEAENLTRIKKELADRKINTPLVADIQFKPKAAEIAARIVEKVRINPGNYVYHRRKNGVYSESAYENELENIAGHLQPLIAICKQYGTAIRIGTNHGSLSERILMRYGNTPEGMVASTMEFIEIFRNSGFHNLIISLKASGVSTMIEANMQIMNEMLLRKYYYPIHLGVTEAGSGLAARIKSAAGIGSLLAMGIGDTLRVSLTENPITEINFAARLATIYAKKKLLRNQPITQPKVYFFEKTSENRFKFPMVFSSFPNSISDCYFKNGQMLTDSGKILELVKNENNNEVYRFDYKQVDNIELIIRASVDTTLAIRNRIPQALWLDNGNNDDNGKTAKISFGVLQALGLRYSKTEFVACPSCGRSRFDILTELEKVKTALSNKPNLKIAVMGCIVNGTGEMACADYGYVGAGRGKVNLYKENKLIRKNIPESEAIIMLVKLIDESNAK